MAVLTAGGRDVEAKIAQFIRISKRVTKAAGFLELDMPREALECLDIHGPLGPFEAEVEILRGEAYRRQQRFQEAAKSFRTAAKMFASPADQEAYMALSVCLRQTGDPGMALTLFARSFGRGRQAAD